MKMGCCQATLTPLAPHSGVAEKAPNKTNIPESFKILAGERWPLCVESILAICPPAWAIIAQAIIY